VLIHCVFSGQTFSSSVHSSVYTAFIGYFDYSISKSRHVQHKIIQTWGENAHGATSKNFNHFKVCWPSTYYAGRSFATLSYRFHWIERIGNMWSVVGSSFCPHVALWSKLPASLHVPYQSGTSSSSSCSPLSGSDHRPVISTFRGIFHFRLKSLLFSVFPHSHLSLAQAYLLLFDHCVFGSHWRW